MLYRLADDDLWRRGGVLALRRRLICPLQQLGLRLMEMTLRGLVVLFRRHLDGMVEIRRRHVVLLLVHELAAPVVGQQLIMVQRAVPHLAKGLRALILVALVVLLEGLHDVV